MAIDIKFTRPIDPNVAKCNFVVHFVMEKRLGNPGESTVPNLGDNLAQLMAWNKCQQAEPNLLCQQTAKNSIELTNY
jgi:hypothetical protein